MFGSREQEHGPHDEVEQAVKETIDNLATCLIAALAVMALVLTLGEDTSPGIKFLMGTLAVSAVRDVVLKEMK